MTSDIKDSEKLVPHTIKMNKEMHKILKIKSFNENVSLKKYVENILENHIKNLDKK